MEFENVSEEVEWEVRRVAAAFEVEKWKQRNLNKESELRFDAMSDHFRVNWWISHTPLGHAHLIGVEVTPPRNHEGAVTWLGSNELTLQYEIRKVGVSTREHMARGLYRVGIEDEDVVAFLNSPLSAHEKMELRLSLPREFWPQKWLDEESANA